MKLRLRDIPLAVGLALEVTAMFLQMVSDAAYDWAEIPRREK